jgi:hypothetical protein
VEGDIMSFKTYLELRHHMAADNDSTLDACPSAQCGGSLLEMMLVSVLNSYAFWAVVVLLVGKCCNETNLIFRTGCSDCASTWLSSVHL